MSRLQDLGTTVSRVVTSARESNLLCLTDLKANTLSIFFVYGLKFLFGNGLKSFIWTINKKLNDNLMLLFQASESEF